MFIRVRTALDLGIINVLRVLIYRIGIKTQLHPVCRLNGEIPSGPYFESCAIPPSDLSPICGWDDYGNLFSHIRFPLDKKPPCWLKNLITEGEFVSPLQSWWKISDFDESIGDIKLIWELSRMDWAVAFAQRARNGDNESLNRLNIWLSDWSSKNPLYKGPNWKCAQEASIRVIHLAYVIMVLGQQKNTTKTLQELIAAHLRRIAATISYAIGQDNNHGTSEAAALFIGGSWLSSLGWKEGPQWEKRGRYLLENRVNKLISADGSFSQYSLNYHRLMLDTIVFAEIWRDQLGRRKFSKSFQKKASRAANWLYQMISPVTGRGPNLGANDGTRILQLTDSSYNDFRPTVHVAMAVFNERCAYPEDGLWHSHLQWLGLIPKKITAAAQKSQDYFDGGLFVIRRLGLMVVLRFPNFRFRPSQADALHLDFWIDEECIFRDAGSFSYNARPDWSWYFSGTSGHNTVQFDDRDQMPKLSRFLYGSWLKTKNLVGISRSNGVDNCKAGYRDLWGASHIREVMLSDSELIVIDKVAGFANKAILRWRLLSGDWHLQTIAGGVLVTNNNFKLYVTADVLIRRCELVAGWESKYYFDKIACPVLEIEVHNFGCFTTKFQW